MDLIVHPCLFKRNRIMKTETDNLNVPPQFTGAETKTEFSITADSEQDAIKLFKRAKDNLTDVNNWDKICGTGSAVFKLIDLNGNPVNRHVKVDDYFKIDIPGPGPAAGDGYDWVQVEKIEESENELTIQVRPASSPQTEKDVVAHFFAETATSSFIVKRDNNTVTAFVIGRNEKPNTNDPDLKDTVRNAVIATGAIAGLSSPQWKSLVKGVISVK